MLRKDANVANNLNTNLSGGLRNAIATKLPTVKILAIVTNNEEKEITITFCDVSEEEEAKISALWKFANNFKVEPSKGSGFQMTISLKFKAAYDLIDESFEEQNKKQIKRKRHGN